MTTPPPDGDHERRRVLPTGEPVLVTMPDSPWVGFIGHVDYYLGEMVVVRIATNIVTDGPPKATVPAHWVRTLEEVLGLQTPADGRGAPRTAGPDGPSPAWPE